MITTGLLVKHCDRNGPARRRAGRRRPLNNTILNINSVLRTAEQYYSCDDKNNIVLAIVAVIAVIHTNINILYNINNILQ